MRRGVTILTYSIFLFIVAIIVGVILIKTRKKEEVKLFGEPMDGKLFRKLIIKVLIVLALPIPLALLIIGGAHI